MEQEVADHGIIDVYEAYSGLMAAVGHEVEAGAVALHLAGEGREACEVESLLKGEEEPAGPTDPVVAGRMKGIQESLVAQIGRVARDWYGEDLDAMAPRDLADALRTGPDEHRQAVADLLLLDGHRQFLRKRFASSVSAPQDLRDRVEEGKLDVDAFAACLMREVARRGYDVPEASIRQMLEEGFVEGELPECLTYLVQRLAKRFSKGLVPLEELVGDTEPDKWLDEARCRLQFRSHSAMHKALADATNLKYDCVHKALSGRQKAKRVQAQIKYCLEDWLRSVALGQEPDIDDEYRGVPVDETQALLPALEQRFRTKEEIYRLLSERTGIKTGSIRRYFQSNGQLKYAPLVVYRWAQRLVDDGADVEPERKSYLADQATREAAAELARRAEEALVRWREAGDDPELELTFRESRRELIASIKEGRHSVPPTL